MRRTLPTVVLAFVMACRTESPPVPLESSPEASLSFTFADADPTSAPIAVAPVPSMLRADRVAPFASATPRVGKSIGHTSVVFRVDFDSDGGALRAAYKPESKRGHKRYRGEVAAYRLARLLKLTNVPPAAVQTFKRDVLRAAMSSDAHALALFDDEVIDRGGRVFGALMPWIDKLEFTPLESPLERARWKKELTAGGELTEDRRALVAQISNLIVFDSLTGNWDRWSGANVGIDKATGTLLFVDNDAAFFDPIPPAFAAQMAVLRGTDRFSRSLIGRLRNYDALTMADALGDEEPNASLLSPRAVAAADQRRKDVLAIIDEKIAALSEAAVLFFP